MLVNIGDAKVVVSIFDKIITLHKMIRYLSALFTIYNNQTKENNVNNSAIHF